MSDRCVICCGARVVRLPTYQTTPSVGSVEPDDSVIADASRTYPCPECSPTAPIERVQFLERHVSFRIFDGMPPDYLEAVKRSAVSHLADSLWQSGALSFADGPSRLPRPDHPNVREQQVSVAVISPAMRKTIEDRIEEHQEALAQEVVNEAKAEIDNWNSYYGGHMIQKIDANRLIGDALRSVLVRRSATKGLK